MARLKLGDRKDWSGGFARWNGSSWTSTSGGATRASAATTRGAPAQAKIAQAGDRHRAQQGVPEGARAFLATAERVLVLHERAVQFFKRH
jgi:hypothetical protein